MKNINFLFFNILVVIFSFTSCDKDSKPVLPESVGTINNILVVCENQIWKDTLIQNAINATLKAPIEGLITSESNFGVSQVENSEWKELLEKQRNILFIQKDSSSAYKKTLDKFASPQTIVFLSENSTKKIAHSLIKNKSTLLKIFKDSEFRYLKKRREGKTNELEIPFNNCVFKGEMPSVYKSVVDTTGFSWFQDLSDPTAMKNILFYETNLTSDSLSISKMNEYRNLSVSKFVEGESEGSFMVTEDRVQSLMDTIKDRNSFYIYRKGLWRMEGEYGGGPFVSKTWFDFDNQKAYTMEGFIYSPNQRKRNSLTNIESTFSDFTFWCD